MQNLYIGATINTSHGFITVADFAHGIGANFFQIFLSSPHNYGGKRHSDSELISLKKKIENYNCKMVIHANYMLNFCNEVTSYKHTGAIDLLVKDLKESSKLGPNCIGVVIHMGKQLNMDKEEAINNYVKGVKSSLNKSPKDSVIIFETGAGQGTEICTKLLDLGDLYRRFDEDEKKRIMFCIDTCHVFSAGYDLSNEKYIKVFDYMVDAHLSWNKIACVHLNDSKCPLDSNKDRHADLGKGFIKEDGLKKFVQLCYSKGVPMVLETPCDTDLDKKTQINMVKKWCTNKSVTNE